LKWFVDPVALIKGRDRRPDITASSLYLSNPENLQSGGKEFRYFETFFGEWRKGGVVSANCAEMKPDCLRFRILVSVPAN